MCAVFRFQPQLLAASPDGDGIDAERILGAGGDGDRYIGAGRCYGNALAVIEGEAVRQRLRCLVACIVLLYVSS